MDDFAALAKDLPAEVLEYIETIEADVKTAEAENTELQKSIDEAQTPPVEVELDPIEKALSGSTPEAVAIFKAQAERLDAAEAKILAQEVVTADAEWVAKAAAFDGVIDKPAEFGPKLRAVADVNPELASEIVSALETAGSRVAEGLLFSEIGKANSMVGADAKEKVATIAKSLQEADPALTEEAARAEVWERNPELYDEYQAQLREAARTA